VTHTEQAYMMAWLAHMIEARVIVEAGTYKGKATRIFAEVNPNAKVYTADIEYYAPELPASVVYHRGDFADMVRAIPSIDFAYIDASGRSNLETRLRWDHAQLVLPKLSPRGIIAFDDTLSEWDGVREIREFCQINLRALKGLSLYQRPE
jgi:predicted O-methyltransferase YrrM